MCRFYLLSEGKARTRLSSSQQYHPCSLLPRAHKQTLGAVRQQLAKKKNPDRLVFQQVDFAVRRRAERGWLSGLLCKATWGLLISSICIMNGMAET